MLLCWGKADRAWLPVRADTSPNTDELKCRNAAGAHCLGVSLSEPANIGNELTDARRPVTANDEADCCITARPAHPGRPIEDGEV